MKRCSKEDRSERREGGRGRDRVREGYKREIVIFSSFVCFSYSFSLLFCLSHSLSLSFFLSLLPSLPPSFPNSLCPSVSLFLSLSFGGGKISSLHQTHTYMYKNMSNDAELYARYSSRYMAIASRFHLASLYIHVQLGHNGEYI